MVESVTELCQILSDQVTMALTSLIETECWIGHRCYKTDPIFGGCPISYLVVHPERETGGNVTLQDTLESPQASHQRTQNGRAISNLPLNTGIISQDGNLQACASPYGRSTGTSCDQKALASQLEQCAATSSPGGEQAALVSVIIDRAYSRQPSRLCHCR